MKLLLDTTKRRLEVDGQELPLYSPEAFAHLSRVWTDVGWSLKYTYTFTWMGRPVIQMPEDLIRVQELIHEARPDVIVETGVAHGGSLVFYASLFKAMGRGRVVGVDLEIRPHNRRAIEAHPLRELITLIEGDSVAPATLAAVSSAVGSAERVMVVLDSNHTREHVKAELGAYAELVTPGSYLVVADGVMACLADVPRGGRSGPLTIRSWRSTSSWPATAASSMSPRRAGSTRAPLSGAVTTYWPGGWLRRKVD